MKLRINGNSIRIRLSKSEVAEFATEEYLSEKTQFGYTTLTYLLTTRPGITDLDAAFDGDSISIYVPEGLPATWAANEVVGYEYTKDLGNDRQLHLLLEKDFKCIDAPPYEDQSDNFENPKTVC